MSVVVRLASLSDLKQIVDMQVAHRSEINAYSSLSFNKQLCAENMTYVILSDINEVIVAHDIDSDELIGYVWITVIAPHYSNDYYYSEQYTYVKPSRRGGSVLAKLINKCKHIARISGAKYLTFGSFSGDTKLTEAYTKRYELLGTIFNINL